MSLPKKENKLSVRFLLNRCRESDKGFFYLGVRVIYRRRKSEYSLGYKLHESNFCLVKERVLFSPEGILRRKEAASLNRLIKEERESIVRSFQLLDRTEPGFGLDRLMFKHHKGHNNPHVETFILQYIDRLREEGKHSTADAYMSGLNSLRRFCGTRKLLFRDIDYVFVTAYLHHLRKRGIAENTVGMYMSNLRALYNKARKLGISVGSGVPFSDLKIHSQDTLKRALTKEEIAIIASCDLSDCPRLSQARDLFMFSFYSRGMSFVDVIHLTRHSLVNGTISYERNKTGQRLQVGMLPVLQEIIEKYQSDNPYVFPFLNPTAERSLYVQYRYALGAINRHLKQLGEQLRIPIPLTTYVARHSWATIAKKEGFSIATISEGLGHTSEETTKIYLQSFTNDTINKINEGVVDAISFCIKNEIKKHRR